MKYNDKVIAMAKEISENCQGNEDAYCKTECPMHTDAMEYVNLIGEGKNKEALLKIREKLFLPGSLGRICAHPCEKKCRRNSEFGEPISIAALKRYAADREDDESLWDVSKKPSTGKKVSVIGAGPAGAQAAIELAKNGHDVTIYEKLPVVGGMMRVGIPAYRLPRNIIDFEYKYLQMLGIKIQLNTEIGKDIAFDELAKSSDIVIVANGAHKGFVPPTKGGDAKGITNAVDYLKQASLQSTTDMVCKNVVVVGGGDVAMDCARTSLRLGAQKVTLISLEKEDALPASLHEQEGAREEGIILLCGYGVQEIHGENGPVSSVTLRECLNMFDAEGRFSPSFGTEQTTVECDTVIFATGQLVEDATGGALKQGRGGRYAADKKTMATAIGNVFTAGDCAGSVIVVEAMALGRKAAISAQRYLDGQDLAAGRDFDAEYTCTTKLNLPLPKDAQDVKRKHTSMMDPQKRKATFEECDFGFDDATAKEEASRCLKCQCKKCMAECIMLNDFTEYPGQLFTQFLEENSIQALCAYSCNMCDQCTLVCPEEYKFAELFGMIRKDMVKANNGESPMEGHKAIKMHQMLGFSKLFTTRVRGGKR